MNVDVLLFDDFDLLDMAGAVRVFGAAPEQFHVNYLSLSGDIVNSLQGTKVWTESLNETCGDGIVVIPGGRGARKVLLQDPETRMKIKAFIRKATACLSIAEGSGYLAQTGELYQRNIAAYQQGENWKRMYTAAVHWIYDVPWMVDGKFYSAAASLQAIDAALCIVADFYEVDKAMQIARNLGIEWEMEAGSC